MQRTLETCIICYFSWILTEILNFKVLFLNWKPFSSSTVLVPCLTNLCCYIQSFKVCTTLEPSRVFKSFLKPCYLLFYDVWLLRWWVLKPEKVPTVLLIQLNWPFEQQKIYVDPKNFKRHSQAHIIYIWCNCKKCLVWRRLNKLFLNYWNFEILLLLLIVTI